MFPLQRVPGKEDKFFDLLEYNGFHETANSIATVVFTRVLSPQQALTMAAVINLSGALWGTAVAETISSGLVVVEFVELTSRILICAWGGAIIWNLVTWWFGLPSSSNRALIAGLGGAALAASGDNWHVIVWPQPHPDHFWLGKGLLRKVIVPMVTSPLAGLVLGFVVTGARYVRLRHARPLRVNRLFVRAQILSAPSMGFMHRTNDAQKTMGIIALTLPGATSRLRRGSR